MPHVFTTYLLILALLLQTAIAPVAFAADPPGTKPTTAQTAEGEIQQAAAEVDAKIDQAAAADPKNAQLQADAAQAHAANHTAAAEVIRLHNKGLLSRLKGLSPAQIFRYVLTGVKAVTKVVYVGQGANWNGGTLATTAGVGSMAAGFGVEVVATAFEFDINKMTQNFPINAEKIPEEKFWRRFLTKTVQNSFWTSAAYAFAIPGIINTLNAVNDPNKAYPQLIPALVGLGTGFASGLAYSFGFLGSELLEKAGYVKNWMRDVGFALAGGYGFYAGLKLLNGGDAQVQAEVFNMLWPMWVGFGMLGLSGLAAKKLKSKSTPANNCSMGKLAAK